MQRLHERFKTAIWVHGTSRGTISIALPASKIKEALRSPDGIILLSSVTESNRRSQKASDNVLDGDLENITVPVLIVANSKDACSVTPPSCALLIQKAMKNA